MLSKPNFFSQKIPFEKIWLKDEDWYQKNKIDLRLGRKVVKLKPKEKLVELDDGTKLKYGKLLLSIGVHSKKWPVKGEEKHGVFYLRTLDDAKALMSALKKARRAVVIGSGFISFEMCQILREAGIETTLVILEPYYWYPLLDERSGKIIEDALQKRGVKILHNSEVREVLGKETVEGVVLKDGKKISCELIIAGIGIFCPLEWLKAAGIATNRGIIANEFLETNLPDIWTAGDSAEFMDLILGERIQLGNWANALQQGKTAGLNMCGKKMAFKQVSFYTTSGFGITLVFVGDIRKTEDKRVIFRAEGNSLTRILIKNGKVIGATLINRTAELGAISKLIEKNTDVSGNLQELSDTKINLSSLV